MLRWRLISAAVIITLLLTAMWLDYRLVLFETPGAWLLPVLLAVSVLATEESLSLLQSRQYRPAAWAVYLGNVLVPLSVSWPIVAEMAGMSERFRTATAAPGWPLAAVAIPLVFILVTEMRRFQEPGQAMVRAGLSVFVVIYIGVLMSFWALLRLHESNGRGMMALLSMLVIVKMADTGAFTVGKNFGRNKLTPVLSPGKTVEGALGGILTACFTSWLFFQFAGPAMIDETYRPPAALASVFYGLVLAIAGMIGDLAESLFKRDMQRKDSSTWLRGLGGVLDIIDAPLVAGPIAWLWWKMGFIYC